MAHASFPDEFAPIHIRMRALSQRDGQLWAAGILVVAALAAGVALLLLPALRSANDNGGAAAVLPQLFFGLIVLVALFNVYVLTKRRDLDQQRQELIAEILLSQRTHGASLLDPVTQSLNRRFMDHLIPREVHRARKYGWPLTFLLADIADFRDINARHGHQVGDDLLKEAARLLDRVCGAEGTVLRYGGDEFLLVLPDCAPERLAAMQSQIAAETSSWSAERGRACKLAFHLAHANWREGADVKELLRAAEANMARARKEGRGETPARPVCAAPECLLVAIGEETQTSLLPILDTLGIAVQECATADEAMMLCASRRFDAAILDSDAVAHSALRQLRTLPGGQGMILIALASAPEPSLRAAANFVFEKPLNPLTLSRGMRVAYSLILGERQRYFRHPVEMPVTIDGGGAAGTCAATNISEGGIALKDAPPLAPRSRVRLRFVLPGSGEKIEATAEVAWSDSNGHAGLRLLEVHGRGARAFSHWIAERHKQTLHNDADNLLALPPRPVLVKGMHGV